MQDKPKNTEVISNTYSWPHNSAIRDTFGGYSNFCIFSYVIQMTNVLLELGGTRDKIAK